MKILTESTPLALWHQAVLDAQTECHVALKTDLEAYLVMLLMRHVNNRELAKGIMATKLLKGMQYPTRQRAVTLQNVGDQCLLITGLFPAVAEKRHVNLRYFIDLGQISYQVISRQNNDIFSLLSDQFVLLMDVLQSFRSCNDVILSPQIRQIWGR